MFFQKMNLIYRERFTVRKYFLILCSSSSLFVISLKYKYFCNELWEHDYSNKRAQGPNAQSMDYHDLGTKLYSPWGYINPRYRGLQPWECYQTDHSLKHDLIGSRAGIESTTLWSWGACSAIWATMLRVTLPGFL